MPRASTTLNGSRKKRRTKAAVSRGGWAFKNNTDSPDQISMRTNEVTPVVTNNNNGITATGNVHDAMMADAAQREVSTPAKPAPIKTTAPGDTERLTIDDQIFFHTKTDGNPNFQSKNATEQTESRALTNFKRTMGEIGTVLHQALILKKFLLSKGTGAAIGLALGVLRDPDRARAASEIILTNVRSALDAIRGKNSNDALGFRKTVMVAICPTVPPDGAPDEILKNYSEEIKIISSELNFSKSTKHVAEDAGKIRKNLLDENGDQSFWLQSHQRKSASDRKLTAELISNFQRWLFEECESVIASPNQRDCIQVKMEEDPTKKEKVRKYYYTFSQREIYEKACRHPNNGGCPGFRNPNNEDEIFISLSTMEKMMPPQLKRMTQSQKQMCGCEICIDGKAMWQALMEFRNRWAKEYDLTIAALLSEGDNESAAALQKSRDEYMSAVFVTEGEQKIQTIDEYVGIISCPSIGETGLQHYNCCIGRCTNKHGCKSTPIIPKQEQIYGSVDGEDEPKSIVTWMQHQNIYTCLQHGVIEPDAKFKSKCPHCKDDGGESKVRCNLERVKYQKPIGDFMETFHKFISDKYRQHKWLVDVNGPRHCIGQRKPETILAEDPLSVLVARDYTDRISAEYNNAAMSTGMGGGNATVGMEGFLYYIKNANKVEMHWKGFLSDWKEQDSKTSYCNLFKFIRHLQEDRGLLPPGKKSVLYIRSDGCGKQYKCANALRLVNWLSDCFRIRIDWMVTAPHHGKNLVDAIAGRDKHDLANAYIRGMDPAQRDHFFKLLSEARKAAKFLSDRPEVNDRKHKLPVDRISLTTRTYEVSNYDELEVDGQRMPAKGCTWEVRGKEFNAEYKPASQGQKRGTKYNTKVGLQEMFHFRFVPQLPADVVAIRRIPCLCGECKSQLDKDWNPQIKNYKKQTMFARAETCWLEPLMGSLNDWHLVKVTEIKGKVDIVEVALLHQDALGAREARVELEIEKKKFGIVVSEDKSNKLGYHLVEWLSAPYPLQSPRKLDGCGNSPMPAGCMTVMCKYWDKLNNQQGLEDGDWFECPEIDVNRGIRPTVRRVWLRNVLVGDVSIVNPGEGVIAPAPIFFNSCNRNVPNKAILISQEVKETIEFEKHLRMKLDLVSMVKELPAGAIVPENRPAIIQQPRSAENCSKKRKLAAMIK